MKIKLFLILILVLSFSACTKNNDNILYTNTEFLMDTFCTISVSKTKGISEKKAKDAVSECFLYLLELEKIANCHDKNSEIYSLNLSKGGVVSYELYSLIKEAVKIEELNREFDITLGIYSEAFKKCYDNTDISLYDVPKREISFTSLLDFNDETLEISFLAENISIDLGGFLKGYAGEKCIQMLRNFDISRAIINLGGNISVVSSDSDSFSIGISDPSLENDYSTAISVFDGETVSTSGDYERYFIQDNKRYCHIIDPLNAFPISRFETDKNSVSGVTVISKNGALSEMLSTAGFVVLSRVTETDSIKEIAASFFSQFENVQYIVLSSSGKILAENTFESEIYSDNPLEDFPKVQIYSDNKLVREIILLDNNNFSFDVESIYGKNTITVQNGEICVTYASCPDKICMNFGRKHTGAPIICLPNRLEIRFT